jgi:hypothetical protein
MSIFCLDDEDTRGQGNYGRSQRPAHYYDSHRHSNATLPSRALAEAINREYKDGEMIVINGEYEGGSSLNFYTRRVVYNLNGRSANLEYGSYFQDAPQIFLTTGDLTRLWNEPARVYLFTDGSKLAELTAALPRPAHKFAESGGKLILTNHQSN